jgi:hypothetical protein
MQQHGRTFSRWLDTWFGPDPVPGSRAAAAEPALALAASGPQDPALAREAIVPREPVTRTASQ